MKAANSSIQRTLAKAHPVKPLSKREIQKLEMKRFLRKTAQRHPDAMPILSRPRPVVSGKRRVPVLVNACGFPFLRIKKPQPSFVSSVIRSKINTRLRRINNRMRLKEELIFASDEDLWDQLTESTEPDSWCDAINFSMEEITRQLKESDHKTQVLAENMWNVVLAERDLAAKEEQQASADNGVVEQSR